MSTTSLQRARMQYLEQQVASASPERLVTLLFDRLLVDVDRAIAAQDNGDARAAGDHLLHAQQIVTELNASLTDAWDGSDDLRALYTYLHGRLVVANVARDVTVTAECRAIVAPLRDAWHGAAEAVATAPAAVRAVG
ncbi:flagellar export chaperone FliS [uncultured Microbacterium sp.]|uniref:flagellar export chaperone FliS n=1 Tax=uncultured Microbacterium sp. TaxID=191216 RepID=UPI0025D7FD27|nr:flagellar export chaperone FliS [uncultured Microbacterium sp.]